jgi:hypothetical protein
MGWRFRIPLGAWIFVSCVYILWSRSISVSIVSDYGLYDRGSIPAGTKDFSSNLCDHTGSEAHSASCTMCTGGLFPGAKRSRNVTQTYHPHLVPRLRMSRSYTSSPPQVPPWSVVGLLCLCLYVVLSCAGRGLCDGLITRPEESYRVSVCVWWGNLNTEKDKAQIWAIVS